MGSRREAITEADAAFGTLPPALLAKGTCLRWLQAPHVAPPAGYYSPELIAHPVYVLAFARGLHRYFPQQLRREWHQAVPRNGGVLHLPETTMLIVGVGGIGAETARLATNFGIQVIATDPRRSMPPPGVSELHPAEELDALLPRANGSNLENWTEWLSGSSRPKSGRSSSS